MTKKNKIFTLFAAALVAMGLSSCSDDESFNFEIVPPTTQAGEKVENPSSMDFTLELSGVKQLAYEVVEGHEGTRASKEDNERGALIFKNATLEGGSGIIDVVDGTNTITVGNLEGDKDYTIYFAFKIGEDQYEVESQNFTTPGYKNIITVLSVSTEGFKVHVELPDSVYWRWGYSESSLYHEMESYGTDDISRLEYNGGLFLKGSQTLDIKNGEVWYEIEQEVYDDDWNVIGTEMVPEYHQIYPGYSYYFLLAECDSTGAIDYTVDYGDDMGGGGWGPLNKLPNVMDYTEEWTSEYIVFNGKYAKVKFDIDAPALQESQLTIEKVKQTERRAVYNIVPSPETVQYAVTILTEEQYNMLKDWVGPEALKWVALNYNSGIFTDAQQIEVSPLDSTTNYKLLVYGSYSDDSMLMSFEEITVSYVASDKPAAELTVEPLSADRIKELGYDPAFMVGFNIKCPTQNCAGVKYIANYAAEWDELLSYGLTDADILSYYGVDIFAADDENMINGINSAEGFDMTFSTSEKTELVVGIQSYNEDEKISDVVVGRVTSLEQVGEGTYNDSPLYSQLAGDWTATYKYDHHFVENWEAQVETLEKTFKVTISSELYAGPAEMDEETYNTLVNYYVDNGDDEATAKAKVEENFADFKVQAQHYTEKYRSLDRMIMTGFDALHPYKSAWDLALDLNHSAATNEDLFYDFGPKMFIQIGADGATLNSDLGTYHPVSSWYKDGYYVREYYLLATNGEDYLPTVSFPIEISEDGNTLTIKAMDGGYYPSIGYTQYGWNYGASFACQGLSDITLTKGWTGTEEAAARVIKPTNKEQKFNPRRGAHRFVKTKLPMSKESATILEKTTIDPSKAGARLIKDMKKREQLIEKLKK